MKQFIYTPELFSQVVRAYLMPGLGWCANWKPQAKNHARGLGNDADHVEGGWGLVWGTGEKQKQVSCPGLSVNGLQK